MNYTRKGDERERAFLGYLRLSQRTSDLPTVRTPDHHLDTRRLTVRGREFDFAWDAERLLVELDGGQWLKGGGRHGSDDDRWKTAAAVAAGWRVIHYSPAQVEGETARMLEQLHEALGGER
jgi:very-short-patch-repair endonuclease